MLGEAFAKLDQVTASKRKRRPLPGMAAQHVGLVAAAFGQAFRRRWVDTRSLERPSWLKRWLSDEESARDHDIQARLGMAGLTPKRVGDREPGADEIASIDVLIGNPLSTPCYRELWRVFSDPELTLDGEEPPLDLHDGSIRRAFERHFMLAYAQAWNGAPGRCGTMSSFREFLVARYWADRLRKLARGRERVWKEHVEMLLGARLMLPEDRSFDFLMLGRAGRACGLAAGVIGRGSLQLAISPGVGLGKLTLVRRDFIELAGPVAARSRQRLGLLGRSSQDPGGKKSMPRGLAAPLRARRWQRPRPGRPR